jgi:hypothetical protein
MAKALPSAQDLGVVSVQPTLGTASYKGATGGEDDVARGLYAAGGQFASLGKHMEEAQEKFDNLQAEDRFNQYQEKLNQIALDPQTGWKNAKGEHAFAAGFNEKYTGQFEDERKKLTDGLDSVGAKRRFSQLSAPAAMRSRAALYEHSAQERVAYDGKVTSDTLKGIKASAWQNHGNDELFDANLARGRDVIQRFASGQGLNEESTKLAVREFESSIWTDRIEAAAAAGNTVKAKEMMGKVVYDKLLTTADKERLDAKIKPQIKRTETLAFVEQKFTEMVPKDPNAPFPFAAMDAVLRKQFGEDPESLNFARSELGYRAGIMAKEQAERRDGNMSAVMNVLADGKASQAAVRNMPEFQALDGGRKDQVLQIIDRRILRDAQLGQMADSRRLMQLEKDDRLRHKNGLIIRNHYLANPDEFKKLTPQQIAGDIQAAVGPEITKELLHMRGELDKPENLTKFRMTKELFVEVVGRSQYGYDVSLLTRTGKLTSDQQEQKDELNRIFVRANQKLGEMKPQTEEAKAQVFEDLLKQAVVQKGVFGGPKNPRPLLGIPTSESPQRAKALEAGVRIPLDSIEKDDLDKLFEAFRGNNAGTPAAKLTNEQILKGYRGVIEKAAAARKMEAHDAVTSLLHKPKMGD